MLLAVEGGGFFSSSATGYSKGLTLLILGNRKEKPMRVLPWNQYQLVDQEIDTDLQLASWKNRLSCGCASFVCFGHSSAGLDGQSALKVGPTEPQDILSCGTTNEKHEELSMSIDDDNARHLSLKSSLKKPSHNVPVSAKDVSERETLGEGRIDIHGFMERRKVQWTDACGKELAEVREFELSETGGSDNEFENGDGKTCSCKIM